jgi:starvation-inducible DNA-binding protein
MEINIGLSDKEREGSVKILSTLLSDEYVLYTKAKNYHWNVTGLDFRTLHKLFGEQYQEIDLIIDAVAERARWLGGQPLGTLTEFLKTSRLKEQPGKVPPVKQMLKNVLDDHEGIIISLREDIMTCEEEFNDMGTTDFLTGIMEQHEKMAWMLRASLSS